MNEKIKKARARLAEITASQTAALAAAEIDGVTQDAKDAAIAQFDALQVEKLNLNASIARFESVQADVDAQVAAAATAAGTAGRGTAAIAAQQITVPARERRHGPLTAFRGPTATQDAYVAGRWAAATIYGHAESARWLADNQGLDIGATLTTRDNGGAAYFVPDVVERAIIELMMEYGTFRKLAEVVPMTSLTLTTPRWTGGMIAYFVAEGQKPTQTDPAWDAIEVVAKDLAAMTKLSRDLAEDSIVNLGDKITTCAAEAFTYKEDVCGFFGDGTSQYGGIVGLITKLLLAENSASLVPAAAGHSTVAALTMADYLKVIGMYPEYKQARPVWVCSKFTWANSMMGLALAAGGTTPNDVAGAGRPTFLGYPVEFCEVMPKTAGAASQVPVLFGDLKLSSKLGTRRGFTVEQGWENDDFTRQLRTVLATQRFGITNHTITHPRDAAQPGPVLGLQLTA